MGILSKKQKLDLEQFINLLVKHVTDMNYKRNVAIKLSLSKETFDKLEIDAIVLQWYAGYIVNIILAYKKDRHGSKGIVNALTKLYIEKYSAFFSSSESNELMSVIELKLLKKIQEQRPLYDEIMETPGITVGGIIHSQKLGIRFANLAGVDDSMFGVASEYGQRLFQECLEGYLTEIRSYKLLF
jgi:hypothetical protein